MRLPSDAELQAAAEQLGVDLAAPGVRARVARHLLANTAEDEQPADEPVERGDGALLSSSQTVVPGGVLVVEVSFYPTSTTTPASEPQHHDDQPTPPPQGA